MTATTHCAHTRADNPMVATGFHKFIEAFLHSMERLNRIQFDAPWK